MAPNALLAPNEDGGAKDLDDTQEQKQLDARARDDAVVDVTGRPSGDTIAEVERFAAGAR